MHGRDNSGGQWNIRHTHELQLRPHSMAKYLSDLPDDKIDVRNESASAKVTLATR